MKKYTFLLVGGILFSTITTTQLKAQITITQANMPGVGSKAVMAVDTTRSLAPQAASASTQTWNYATLQNSQTNGYLFVNPSATSYYPFFHASNLADSLVYGNGYTYLTSTASDFSANGYGENYMGFAGGIALHPAYDQLPLPATYGTKDGGFSRADTSVAYSAPPIDSVRIIINIHYADTVDAFGTMTTPYASAEPVIRQKHYDLTIDSALVHSSGFWILYQTTTTKDNIYRWYTNAAGVNYYFATMQMDYTNSHDSIVQWFNGTNLGVNNIVDSKYTTVYPNPCKTEITFNCSSPDARKVSVFDITGRQLAVQEMKNGMLIMNTSAYSAGMYLYRVSDILGNVLDRGKFTVQ